MSTGRGWELIERARAGEVLVFDGGMGTMLFAAGLVHGPSSLPGLATLPPTTEYPHNQLGKDHQFFPAQLIHSLCFHQR